MSEKKTSTTALVVILHTSELLPKLLRAWRRVGVPGVTIFPSLGGYEAEKQVRRGTLGNLLNVFSQEDSGQRTLICLVDEPETLEKAVSEADRVVKGFDSPRSGILFTLPVGEVLGLQKWREEETGTEPEVRPSAGESNLLQWFQEDVKKAYGSDALVDWSSQRKTRVSEIARRLSLKPIVVRVDTPVSTVLGELLRNPEVATVCVVNTEEHLMGTIHINDLADVMMVPVIPEAFVDNPEEYEKALRYVDPDKPLLAADIMRDPVYAMYDASLEETYQRMKKHKRMGIPVVNQYYHVKGYITMTELLAICYPEKNEEPK